MEDGMKLDERGKQSLVSAQEFWSCAVKHVCTTFGEAYICAYCALSFLQEVGEIQMS